MDDPNTNKLLIIKQTKCFIHKDIYFTGTNSRIVNIFADTCVSQSMVHGSMSVHGVINAVLLIILYISLQLTLHKFIYTRSLL